MQECKKLSIAFALYYVSLHKNLLYYFCISIVLSTRQCSNILKILKARTHRDEYRRALFASVFQRVFSVHTQAIFADDEPSEHANSFPDIR